MAAILPQGKTQFCDANGAPLANGLVLFFARGTTTLKATYQDTDLTIQNTNPVVLDASGSAEIWGAGAYTQGVFDLNGVQIYEADTSDGATETLSSLLNIAALRAAPASFSPSGNVFLSGGAAAGDGGGGIFTFNPTSTATDDGATVINQTGNIGPGRWIANPGLTGQQLGSFTTLSANNNENGWRITADSSGGILRIENFGINTSGVGGNTIMFPYPYPNACLGVYLQASGASSYGNTTLIVGTVTNSSFQVFGGNPQTNTPENVGFYWHSDGF